MKTGKSLVEMATELQRRQGAKQDFLAPTKSLQVDGDNLVIDNNNAFALTDHAHRQMGTWAGVPAKYYDRMRQEAPQLLARNVNHWLHESDAARMVRTLDGNARAFLSDRYRRIDNEDVAQQVLPIFLNNDNSAQIVSCEVTERRMYIKALFPKVSGEIVVGDEVQAGVVVSNSEIGLGALSIQPLIYRLVCNNGMISQDHGLSRYHVGRKIEGDGDAAYQLFSDETMKLDDQALMMKIRDILLAASKREVFDAIVAKMREAREGSKIVKPVEAVTVLAKRIDLNEGESMSVLENLIKGGDYTRYGMLNAVTAAANNHDSYDRATELESAGGKILDLPPSEWKVIAEAA